MDVLISAKLTSRGIETHSKYVLPFSAMDQAPACVTGHLSWPKNPVQMCKQFVNKTRNLSHQKTLLIYM